MNKRWLVVPFAMALAVCLGGLANAYISGPIGDLQDTGAGGPVSADLDLQDTHRDPLTLIRCVEQISHFLTT